MRLSFGNCFHQIISTGETERKRSTIANRSDLLFDNMKDTLHCLE